MRIPLDENQSHATEGTCSSGLERVTLSAGGEGTPGGCLGYDDGGVECVISMTTHEYGYRLFVIGLHDNVSIVAKREGVQVSELSTQPTYADTTEGCKIGEATLQI